MADVAFDSNKHAQTRQDVEHGGAAIASSSEAITRLSNGQYERFWTDEAGPQALRNAFIAFLGAYDKIATTERDTLRSFGRNVDQAIEDFAAVEQATGDELKALRDSMGDPSSYTSPTPTSSTNPSHSRSTGSPHAGYSRTHTSGAAKGQRPCAEHAGSTEATSRR